jgi:diacylglycerol kinase family enzyme
VAAPVQKIDVALANGQLFLCSSTLAMMPHLGRLREQVRGGLDRRTVPLIGRAVRLLWRYPRMPLTIVVDGTEHEVRARAVVVSNNPLAASKPVHSRDRLDTGLLGVYIAQDRTNWDLLALAARMVGGTWRRDERLLTYVGQRVEIDSPALALMSVMSDGEITQLQLPLRYEIRPRALAMLTPRGMA